LSQRSRGCSYMRCRAHGVLIVGACHYCMDGLVRDTCVWSMQLCMGMRYGHAVWACGMLRIEVHAVVDGLSGLQVPGHTNETNGQRAARSQDAAWPRCPETSTRRILPRWQGATQDGAASKAASRVTPGPAQSASYMPLLQSLKSGKYLLVTLHARVAAL